MTNGDIFRYASQNIYDQTTDYYSNGTGAVCFTYFNYSEDAKRYLRGLMKLLVASRDSSYPISRGYSIMAIFEYYLLTRDKSFLLELAPLLKAKCQEIREERKKTMILKKGTKPPHYGLLPPGIWGGDIHAGYGKVYSLRENIHSWQVLHKTGHILKEIGEERDAQELLCEADAYKKLITKAMRENVIKREDLPPFIPLVLYFKESPFGPDPFSTDELMGSYHYLAIPMIYEHGFWDGEKNLIKMMFEDLEAAGGMILGMIRFIKDFINPVFTSGYLRYLLQKDEIDKFLYSFYGFIAHALSRNTYVSGEDMLIQPERLGRPEALFSSPCLSAPVTWLRYFRLMLIWEEYREMIPTGEISLAWAVPRRWLEDGKEIKVERALTYFGEMSYEITSKVKEAKILVSIAPPKKGNKHGLIKLRLRHPGLKPIKKVKVNGRNWSDFNPEKEFVSLPLNYGKSQVEVGY